MIETPAGIALVVFKVVSIRGFLLVQSAAAVNKFEC